MIPKPLINLFSIRGYTDFDATGLLGFGCVVPETFIDEGGMTPCNSTPLPITHVSELLKKSVGWYVTMPDTPGIT